MNKVTDRLFNDLCLDERIEDGTFDITNNAHIDIMREYLMERGIPESDALEFSNRVVEAGKHPERQAYNKNGILVTFPTPQHKQNAIRRGTHFEKDPTKGRPNLFGPDPETGKPRRGPGRPPKDDKKEDGDFTPPSKGGGQSIQPSGGASSLPLSGTETGQSPEAGDTATTTSAPEPDTSGAPSEPVQQGPPDVQPPKPPEEKQQDKLAIQKMMASRNTSLGSPLDTQPTSVVKDPQMDKTKNNADIARLYMQEALKMLENMN